MTSETAAVIASSRSSGKGRTPDSTGHQTLGIEDVCQSPMPAMAGMRSCMSGREFMKMARVGDEGFARLTDSLQSRIV